jgi:hypothetical protein
MQLSHLEQVYGNDYDHVCQNWHEQGVKRKKAVAA